MYARFFGLRESPFKINPDPRYLFVTDQTREALATLTYGIQQRKGVMLLTGEVGTGKTTLLNCLLDWMRSQRISTAFIFNSKLNENQLLRCVVTDFGIPAGLDDKSQMLLRLNEWLLDRYRAGGSTVLIVDEAQNLSSDVLEEIRLLTNLETSTEKLLQIILAGQPELEEKLRSPRLRQLRQRITLRCRTAPLVLEETYAYVAERLRIAGSDGQPVFSKEAIEAVHLYSQGIPRVVNLLCEHSLIGAYVEHLRPVPAHVVEEVAREFEFDRVLPTADFAIVPSQRLDSADGQLLMNISQLLNAIRQMKASRRSAEERKP